MPNPELKIILWTFFVLCVALLFVANQSKRP